LRSTASSQDRGAEGTKRTFLSKQQLAVAFDKGGY